MTDPLIKMKEFLTEQEKEKLKFSVQDHKEVFRKIQEMNPTKRTAPSRVKIVSTYIFTSAAICILLFTLLLQSPLQSKVLAAFPFIGSFFSEYGDEGLKEAVKKKDLHAINQTAEDQGIKITMNEIFYDGARISVAYTLEAQDKRKGENFNIFLYDLKVNGKSLNNYGISGVKETKKGNQYIKINNVEISQPLPDQFKLDFSIQELVSVSKGESVKGNWAFSLPVSKAGTSYQYIPNVSKKTDREELKVTSITFGPSGIKMKIILKQKQELVRSYMRYRILDDKNRVIESLNEGATIFRYKNKVATAFTEPLLMPVKKIPDYITVQPYQMPYGNGKPKETIKQITEKLPIVLPQGEKGRIIINKIEKKKNEIWVYYKAEGDVVEDRVRNLYLLNTQSNFKPDNFIEGKFDGNRKSASQMVRFKTSYKDNLYFLTADWGPRLIKELQLKIPIDKSKLIKKENK